MKGINLFLRRVEVKGFHMSLHLVEDIIDRQTLLSIYLFFPVLQSGALIHRRISVHTIDIEQEIPLAAILLFHHGERFGGKSSMFGNQRKRKRRAVCANCTVSPCVSGAILLEPKTNGSVAIPVTANLIHMQLFSWSG